MFFLTSYHCFFFFVIPVYALYKKNPKIFILTIPIILQFVIGAILTTFKFSNENVFNYQCDVHTVPVDGVYLGYVSTTASNFTESTIPLLLFMFCSISVILAHAALWLVTFVQRKVAGGHAAVVKLVVHEGAWIFVLLSGKNKYSYCFRSWFLPQGLAIVAGIFPYSYASRVGNPSIMFGY